MSFFKMGSPLAARRFFLQRSGIVLSGAAVALLAGRDALAASSDKSADKNGGKGHAGDVRILNTALAAELEAVAAYAVGAKSGLLQKPVLDLRSRQSLNTAFPPISSKTRRTCCVSPRASKKAR
jgi:hypothetical protein